ncbi:MAG: hypothetical protein KGZ39_07750 [Simkania sp.]|nr:hypothetical protein [Simkania sp.]
MLYDTFLAVMNQLAGQRKARCVVQGSVIFIESKPVGKQWSLATCVFDGGEYLPRSVKECVSSAGVLRWQERGANLRLDPASNSIYLVQEIQSSSKYVPFRYLMSDFAEVANEWRDILDDFAARDHSSIMITPKE